MTLTIKSAQVTLDQNLTSLNTWLSHTTINSILAVTLLSNSSLLILYT